MAYMIIGVYGTYARAEAAFDELLSRGLDQEADQAMDITARHGPVNIDEVSTRWRREGWTRYEPAAAAMTQDEIELERSATPQEKATSPIHEVQG